MGRHDEKVPGAPEIVEAFQRLVAASRHSRSCSRSCSGRTSACLPRRAARPGWVPFHSGHPVRLAWLLSRAGPPMGAGQPLRLRVVLVVLAVAHLRLGPSPSAATSTSQRVGRRRPARTAAPAGAPAGHSATAAAVRYQHAIADRDAAIARELDRLTDGQ